MTKPDWNTPNTDGWHWLRWKGARPAYLGFYSHLREYWIVYAMNGVSDEYPPESVARLFDYIGPIPEPGSQARLVECLKNTLVLAEARIESIGEYVDDHPTVIEARALIKENGYE